MPSPPAPGRRYGGRTAAERQAERRTKLLDGALDLLGSGGYAAMTIEAVCTASRLNQRYFYEQFRTREDLLRAVYDRDIERVATAVLAAVAAAPDDLRANTDAGVRTFVTEMLADERSARVAYLEIVGVSPELERHRRAVLRMFAAVIAEQAGGFAARGLLPERDYTLTAMALVGAVEELLADWLSRDPRPSSATLVDELVEIYLAAVSRPVRTTPPPPTSPG